MTSFTSANDLCNVVSLAVYCKDDYSMMITLENNTSEFWIPSLKALDADTWYNKVSREAKEIFEMEVDNIKLLHLYKIWLPDFPSLWIYHCVYGACVTEDAKRKSKATRGKYRGKIRWIVEQELSKLWVNGNLRSPEMYTFFLCLREQFASVDNNSGEKLIKPVEYGEKGKITEVGQEVFVSFGKSIYELLIESAGFSADVQKHIYREFLFFCFPSVYMGLQAFVRLMMELGWSREDAPYVFKSADVTNRFGLSYREFLYILAAIDPNTNHGGPPAEIRCRYLFRFFDQDRDGILSQQEFRKLITFMRKSKSLPADLSESMKDADGIYKNLGFSTTTPLTIGSFLIAVGSLKIRGTSHTFRSNKSTQQYIQDIMCALNTCLYSTVILLPFRKREAKVKTEPQISKREIPPVRPSVTQKTDTKSYELAVHSVRLQKSATLINVEELWNMQHALSQTALKIVQSSSPQINRRVSMSVFNQTSQCNELLKSLRYLQQLNKSKTYTKGPLVFSWGHLDAELFAHHLMKICEEVQQIFKKEDRLLTLSAPIYVMGKSVTLHSFRFLNSELISGDLHGNIEDLIYFEKVFWHLGPCLCPCNLLFLGDYVDRGSYGIEVVTYLFSYKIQTPNKVWLLRGNHEVRDIQRMFSFETECHSKFGDKMGKAVWEAINSAFDHMPLAASIDDKIFCCHGGIPPPWLCPTVAAINQIPVPLSQPDQQCALAWELLWNDPVKKHAMTENVVMELLANDGFAPNSTRGTAHVFSVEALEKFLNTNNYTHIIRAHEVAQAGFNVQQKAKLLTVFSSSKYCGGQNEAACVLADQGKLRILRIETG